MLTKNQIVERLFVGKNFNDCIRKMEPEHLQEDLRQDVICIVCEWPDEKVIKLHQENALEFYVVRVILNQVKSNTSPFTKTYRQNFTPFDIVSHSGETYGKVNNNPNVHRLIERRSREIEMSIIRKVEGGETKQDRELRERIEDLTMEEIDSLYWYDSEILRLYLKLGSFRAIQEETGIPFISCYKNIQKSLKTLKEKAENHTKQLFSKRERYFIQNNKHAGVLSNTV